MFGYQTWGHRTLQALLDSDHEVVLAVTHPRSEHAYEKIWDDSVADLAAENGIPVLLRNRPDDDVLASCELMTQRGQIARGECGRGELRRAVCTQGSRSDHRARSGKCLSGKGDGWSDMPLGPFRAVPTD